MRRQGQSPAGALPTLLLRPGPVTRPGLPGDVPLSHAAWKKNRKKKRKEKPLFFKTRDRLFEVACPGGLQLCPCLAHCPDSAGFHRCSALYPGPERAGLCTVSHSTWQPRPGPGTLCPFTTARLSRDWCVDVCQRLLYNSVALLTGTGTRTDMCLSRFFWMQWPHSHLSNSAWTTWRARLSQNQK